MALPSGVLNQQLKLHQGSVSWGGKLLISRVFLPGLSLSPALLRALRREQLRWRRIVLHKMLVQLRKMLVK